MKYLIIIISLAFSSCATVHEYEMYNLTDEDMLLGERGSSGFENTFQIYREGAVGGNGAKTGGGCGCN